MSTQMRKLMDNFEEHLHKAKNREVIISYDITADYNKFRSDILALIEAFGITQITQSTYKLNRRLNGEELDQLCNQIIALFDELKNILNEGAKKEKRVKVVAIFTLDNTFFEEILVDEVI